MGWRLKVSTTILLLMSAAGVALAGEHKPPDFMNEVKAVTDSGTVLSPRLGIVGTGGFAFPIGSRTFSSDIADSRGFAVGVCYRTRLRKSHVLSYTPTLSFYFEHLTPDEEAIVDRYRVTFGLSNEPFKSTGGERTIMALLFENLISAPWTNRPIVPFAKMIGGVGRYEIEDLRVEWDDEKFGYLGYDDWIAIFGGALGVMHEFDGRHFIALELRVQAFGSLTTESEEVDTHIGPLGPAESSSTPATIGLQLTAGVSLF